MKAEDCKVVKVIGRSAFGEVLSLVPTETKAESEQVAQGLLEEQYLELTKERKQAASRNRQEMTDKDPTVSWLEEMNRMLTQDIELLRKGNEELMVD
ncbi:Rho-Associated Protein Kinase 1 [Manis pentadactyla]|nr:Rho-Associated Protein Kinase 1 [Manis pentadactyla]